MRVWNEEDDEVEEENEEEHQETVAASISGKERAADGIEERKPPC